MDFRQIEAFVNVVRYKSFSRAADATFLTQPTISTHIASLEKELGVPLIDRKSREAVPTPEGKLLYRYALDLLNTREKASLAVQRAGRDVEGVLEIQTSSVPGEYIVPSLLAGFRADYPGVRFYVEQSDSGIVERNLLEHKGELGFVGTRGSKDLEYEKLFSDRLVLITPKTEKFLELAAHSDRIAPADLAGEPFIWREQGSATRKEFESRLAELMQDPRDIHAVARLNSLEAIKQAVGEGLGVSVVSGIAAEFATGTECRRFLVFSIDGMDLTRDFFLAWNKNTALSPRAEAFRSYVASQFSSLSDPLL